MNNKVKFLRGTSNEYTVAEKDNDTIYFTTDDGKLYIGDKEVSGDGGLTIDDTLSDTSTNPVQNKVVKQAIDNKADKSLYGDTTINVGRKAGTDIGKCSTAEGYNTTASGEGSHAEGIGTKATGRDSHAEGAGSVASGFDSHAGGNSSIASGLVSFSHGIQTSAQSVAEVAFGKYNISRHNTLFSVGDGTADDARHNAFEITTDGGKLHDKDIATTDLIPTELPANGGNADTVGGKLPEKIFYDNGFSTDLNDATQSGCYATSPDTLNAPLSSWWLVDTMNFNNQFIVQKAHALGDTAHTVSYIRNYANDVWSEWEEISTTPIKTDTITSNSDGAGYVWLPQGNGRKYISAIAHAYTRTNMHIDGTTGNTNLQIPDAINSAVTIDIAWIE